MVGGKKEGTWKWSGWPNFPPSSASIHSDSLRLRRCTCWCFDYQSFDFWQERYVGAIIIKYYCWDLKLEEVRNRFLIFFFFCLWLLPLVWIGLEWELTEKNKTFLGSRYCIWVWFCCHTLSLCGRLFRQTKSKSVFYWIFLKGSSECAMFIALLVLGQPFSLLACREWGTWSPGNYNWSLQLPVSSQTSEFTLAKKYRFKYISGEIWFH